jgi:predicted ester cyclase
LATFACDYASDKPFDNPPMTTTATVTAPSASAMPSASVAAPVKPPPAEAIAKAIAAIATPWNAHDAAGVAAHYEATAKLVEPGSPDVVGSAAIGDSAKATFTAYPDFKVAVTRTFLQGSTLVYEWVFTGKNDGPAAPGQKPTGRQVGVAGASLVMFDDDGLIKEEHRIFDAPTLTSQLDPKAKAGTFRAPLALPTAATEAHVSKGTPDEAKTIEQGNAIIATDQTLKLPAVLTTVTPDYVWEDYSAPTTYKTADLKTVFATFATAFPDLAFARKITFAADGFYVTEADITATQKGPLGPIKASNKPVKTRTIDIQLINKDGKATKEWSYSNNADLLMQIGALPSPSAAASASAAGSASAAPSAKPAPSAAPSAKGK